MQLIQSYNPAYDETDPALYEGEDGVRLLVVNTLDDLLGGKLLDKAQQDGAMLVWVADDAITARLPIDISIDGWVDAEAPITYTQFIQEFETPKDPRDGGGNFVHLHTHSEYSSLDGLSSVQEIVDRAVADGQTAVAITDHGNCASHPMLQNLAQKAGIKPIFGIEAYFVDDRFRRPIGLEGKKKADLTPEELAAYEADNAEVKDYYHLILWAMDDIGLHNLWAISTEANRDGYYRHPRMDWDTLTKYSEGVMCSTACLRGPICHELQKGDSEHAVANLARLNAIFHDRLYVEIHTSTEPDVIKLNPGLVEMAKMYGVPTIAVSDSHYSCCEHKHAHNVWIAAQTGNSVNDDAGLFSSDADYHVMTEQEVRNALNYLDPFDVDEAIANTVVVANRCTAELKGDPTPPVFSARGGVEEDVRKLVETCMGNWHKTTGKVKPNQEYEDRFVMEINLLIEKKFCGYFLMVSDYCLWAKRKGILLGPGRGSGGGSLVAYLAGITEIDPVETELLFERFMTKGRTELPDFDIDFPSSRIEEVLEYISNKWGANSVVRIGTHMRLKNKGVIRKLASALQGSIQIDWNDIDAMSKLIEKAESSSAGLGISWDELWTEYATELAPYRAKYPELFKYADIFVGRLNAYGKHAAGVIISPGNDLTSMLPLRVGEDGRLISEYDMDAIAFLGLVKFDFLAVTTLDTLQMCVDLVKARTGEVINLYGWRDEYLDQEVWDFLSAGNTKGCFQIETPAGTKITKELKPNNIHDLADVITLDRPGPMRSGLDRSYLRRRHGQEKITYVDPRLETVLDRSYGVLLYQEDIMKTCMVLAGYDGEEADKVRKILGKKKVDAAREEGRKFLPACIERGMEEQAANLLWNQMEEFSRYSFNRAHAYGYALLAYWCAALKFHHPQEFYVAVMSTLDSATKDKVGNFVMEARKRGHDVLPPDINESGEDFSIIGPNIRFGLKSINGVGDVAVGNIIANQPYASFIDFRERSGTNLGVVKKLIRIGAFDAFGTHRRTLEVEVEREESGELERCVHWDSHKTGAPNDLPCTFDWDSEPVRLGARGKPLKQAKIPARCTIRCRNYQRGEHAPVETDPYTDAEIRKIEMELLGVHLSSTPFDYANEKYGDQICTASQADAEDKFDQACVLGIVQKIREKVDKNGKAFAVVSLFAQDGVIDALCFNKYWKEFKSIIKEDSLVMTILKKNERGYQLYDAAPAESL